MRRISHPDYVYTPWSAERRAAARERERARLAKLSQEQRDAESRRLHNARVIASARERGLRRIGLFEIDCWDGVPTPQFPEEYRVQNRPARRGPPPRPLREAAELLQVEIDRDDAFLAAAAAYMAAATVGPSVARVSEAVGLPYDFCCALAQNWRQQRIWRSGIVTWEGEEETYHVTLALYAMCGLGRLVRVGNEGSEQSTAAESNRGAARVESRETEGH